MNIKHLLFGFLFFLGFNGINSLSADCSLWDLTVQKSACNGEKFYVKINFKYQEVSNCFTVSGNGKNYGPFLYSKLPIVIDGLIGDCHTEYEFEVIDCDNNHCFISKKIGTVCCFTPSCKISDLKLEKTVCDTDDNFYVLLDFNYENTSTCFKLKINDLFYGQYDYTSLPIKIGPLKGDCLTDRIFAVYDCEKPDACFAKIEMDRVCCSHDCKISNIKIEKTDCDNNDKFFAIVSFKAENVSDSFYIRVNDSLFGKFKYGSTAYKVGPFPGDCITKYKFLIFDEKNTHCAEDTLWGPICCGSNQPCKLGDLIVEKSDCNADNQFYLHVDFKHINTSDCFKVFINNDLYAEYKYADLPLELGPFNGDCRTEYRILIKDCKDEHCALEKFIGVVCCPPSADCKLTDLVVEKSDCNVDNQFYLHVDFKHINTSDCFKVFINNDLYAEYKYSDLPIELGPFPGDCHTEYKLIIKDCLDEHCAIDKFIGRVCCPPSGDCLLSELEIKKEDCNTDNQFNVTINFLSKNTSDCFNVFVAGHSFGPFKYIDLPIKIGPFNGDCNTEYVFLIKDCDKPDCRLEKSIGKVCCPPGGDCKIDDLRLAKTDCTHEGNFFVYLNFNHVNTSHCFKLKINDDTYGVFDYASLPIKIGPLKGDCITNRMFAVYDCEKPDACFAKIEMDKVCCEPSMDCKLYDLVTDRTDCDANGEFYVYFKFKSVNTSDCFRIKGNGNDYGEFKYTNLPVKLGPFKGDCHTNYEFLIQDCKNERCAIEKNLGTVCCGGGGDCKLSDLKLVKTDCNSDRQFFVYLNFKYTGVSECFRVRGNGHDYGEFRYGQLPIKLGPFLGDCNTNYEFGVEDCIKHDCHITADLGKVCCDASNLKIYEVVMTRTDCEPDSTFNVKFNFHYKDVSDSFNVLINGKLYSTFGYNQIPVTIGSLFADCKTSYKIQLIDQKDTTIRVIKFIEKPCCHTNIEDCKIYDVLAHPQHCTGPNEYALLIDFKHQGTTNQNFEVFDRNGQIGYFTFSQLPITIHNFKASGRDFDFVKICENDNPRCCTPIEFRTIVCDSLTNNPRKFRVTDLIVKANNSSNRVSLFSELEIPGDLEIEMFNLEGRQVPIDIIETERQPHEIFISSSHLMTDLYFIRIKSEDSTKTYKFFHIR